MMQQSNKASVLWDECPCGNLLRSIIMTGLLKTGNSNHSCRMGCFWKAFLCCCNAVNQTTLTHFIDASAKHLRVHPHVRINIMGGRGNGTKRKSDEMITYDERLLGRGVMAAVAGRSSSYNTCAW